MTGPDKILGSRNPMLVALGLLAVALIKPVQDHLDIRRQNRAIDPDILYFVSPRLVKTMALGYESLIADIYWMRVIQYYGRRDEADRRPVRYKNLAALLDITTTLDPDLLDVYRAGSNFLGEADPVGAGQPQESLKLLDKGIRRHPTEWRLYFDKGFVYYSYLGDSARAGDSWLQGSRLPNAPPWMEALGAMGMSKAGALDMAKELYRHQYAESNRKELKENALNHLNTIRVYEDLWMLEFCLEKYEAIRGNRAPSLEAVVHAGILKSLPVDPSGIPYSYDPVAGTVGLDSKSRVRLLSIPAEYRNICRAKLENAFNVRERPRVPGNP